VRVECSAEFARLLEDDDIRSGNGAIANQVCRARQRRDTAADEVISAQTVSLFAV
jgi:hypothetical protein